MRFFIKLDHSLLLVFFLDYHPLYWKCLIHYMNIQWHYLLLPTIYEWNVKKPRWITRLSRYSMRCTIFNRSWKYFRWRNKGYVQSACNAFFYVSFYILYIQFAVSEKACSNIFLLTQKQSPEVFCEKMRSSKFRKIYRKTPVLEPLPATLLKRGSSTGVFMQILRNFEEHIFSQNTSGDCFY